MNETILLYNITEPQDRKRIRKAMSSLGISIVYVDRKDYLKPVGALAGGKLFLTVDREYTGPELDGPMMVMAGLDGERVDLVLQKLRESGTESIACKAVLTETNQFWTSVMLYEELKKEHAAFNG